MRGVWPFVALMGCSSTPEPARALVMTVDIPTALGVNGDAIFWTTQAGDFFAASKNGGPTSQPIHLSSTGIFGGSQLAFDETAIYVATVWDGVYRINRLTSEITQIESGFAPGVATNFGGDVYWSATSGVKRRTLGATTAETLSNDDSLVVALDATGVHWIDGFDLHMICIFCDPCKDSQFPLRRRANDGTVSTLATITPGYESLTADGDALYASDSCAGTITRFDHVGGGTSTLASGLTGVGPIATDERDVYAVIVQQTGSFGVVTVEGRIVRVPKAGGGATTLPTRGRAPSAIALDDTTVYYVAREEGSDGYAIFAMAKPRP